MYATIQLRLARTKEPAMSVTFWEMMHRSGCVVVLLLLPGCYESRVPSSDGGVVDAEAGTEDSALMDAETGCGPNDIYPTNLRVVTSAPTGCAGPDEDQLINIRFPFDEFLAITECGTGSFSNFTPAGPCEWMVDYRCTEMFQTTEAQGVLRLSDGEVSGRLEQSSVNDVAICNWTVELGE